MVNRSERLSGPRERGDRRSTDAGRGRVKEWTEEENETFRTHTATRFAHKIEIGASLSGKIDILPGVSIFSALERVGMIRTVVKLILKMVSSAFQSDTIR